jgi:hypothetical protein
MRIVPLVTTAISDYLQIHSQIPVFVTLSIMMMVKILYVNPAISLALIVSVTL